jgi:ribose 5-phosphate isomerase B
MVVAVGADHAGAELKGALLELLRHWGHEGLDMGTTGQAPVDYPDFAQQVCRAVLQGRAHRGVLICGTGIGMSIAANRFQGIRAALCHEPLSARLSRLHNDANVLVLAGRLIGRAMAEEVLRVWLQSPFEGGRHQRRLEKIAAFEEALGKKP